MRLLTALVCLAALLGASACGDEESSPPTTTVLGSAGTSSAPEATTTTEPEETEPAVTIETAAGDQVVVPVEVADSPQEREVGLMNRTSLPADAGMIFLFDEDSSGGFWMRFGACWCPEFPRPHTRSPGWSTGRRSNTCTACVARATRVN